MMVARLGEVLFWAGCILAALVILAGLVLFSGTNDAGYGVLTLLVAGLVFLVGRAARYVLADR